MRLDKFISNHSLLSRKEVKSAVKSKRIVINSDYALKPDCQINEATDKIYLDNSLIDYRKYTYILLNKPAGYVSANKDELNKSVFELIDDYTKNLSCVGRLDKDTEGLLLITDDGILSHDLLSPKNHVAKKYYVEALNDLSDLDVELLESGKITLDNKLLKPAKVELISKEAFNLIISEGKYHQVKRMLEACNNEVVYLKRIAMGKLLLPADLAIGKYIYLEKEEII